MEIEIWNIWVMAGLVLLMVEIFIPTFLPLCIAIGCFSAALASGLDFSMKFQMSSFSVGTLIAFFGIRPFLLNIAASKGDLVKTNVEALIGQKGWVTEQIVNEKNSGRVKLAGDGWRAESFDNAPIDLGKQVEVVKVNSTILIVKTI